MKLYPFVRNITSFPLERWRAKAPAYLAAGLLLGSLIPSHSLAQESSPAADDLRSLRQKIQELEQKLQALERTQAPASTASTNAGRSVEELEQKVRILERNRELDQEAVEARTKEAPKITLGEKGFGFSSADTNFAVQLKGVLQVDSRTFFDDSGTAGNDGILLRRARPILQGTVFRDFDFLFVPDFGGTSSPQIYDAYLNYRYNPALQLQAGKFKTPVGLEQLQSDKDILFNERALPTDLVPNRDLGFMLHGDLLENSVSYAVGVFNGIGDARNSSNADFEDDKSIAARLFFLPFKTTSVTPLQGLGFGVGGSYETFQATNTTGLPNNNGYATVGQQQFFTYNNGVVAANQHWRLSPQTHYYYGPFGVLGEYVISDQKVSLGSRSARLENTAWQIAGSWVLTGEDASFTGVVPRHPFDPREGNWGAWQLVARYSELDIDPDAFPTFANPNVSAHNAQEWSVGLNWYLNRNVKVATSFAHTIFGGAGAQSPAPGPVTRKDENVLFTRIQLAF